MTEAMHILGTENPLYAQAIEFIWREAELLDQKRYTDWGKIWAEDGVYVIPTARDETDFASSLNYVYDDARMRKLRIERLDSGLSMSAVDSAVTVRTVSRFQLAGVQDDTLDINAAQILVGYKRGTHTIFAADINYGVRFEGGVPKLTRKVIRLINADDSLSAIGFLL